VHELLVWSGVAAPLATATCLDEELPLADGPAAALARLDHLSAAAGISSSRRIETTAVEPCIPALESTVYITTGGHHP